MARGNDTDLYEGLLARQSELDARYEAAKDRRAQKVRAADDQFRMEVQPLQEERELVAKLLEIRARNRSNEIPEVPTPPHLEPVTKVGDFIIAALKATGPKTKEQLRDMASDAGYRVNGRQIHAVVLNVLRAGKIVELQDGVYGMPPTPGEFDLTGRLSP